MLNEPTIEKLKALRLDAMASAWTEQQKPYIAKGATGFGVRLLANFILNRAAGR